MTTRSRPSPAVSAERLVAFLSDPRSYPERPRQVHLIQTHASYLVLAGRHAYKVKKPVNLGFLDFSTLEKRRHFCAREIALNRRLCPEVYLGVVPISEQAGRIVLGDGGEIVEYAVKMQRLPERHFMLQHLARGEAGPREVEAIVATLTPFYQAHQPTPEIAAWGRVRRLRISTAENFRQTKPFIGATLSRPAFEAIRQFTNAFYRRHASLFAARLRERRIRDCHGDLHLEHIHLSPARLTIYDCIEFNDRFRYIDVASDVAFLAMDFDFRGRPDLSRHFATRMARALRDPGLLRLLDFYKCYRAYVRGKVESLRQLSRGLSPSERAASRGRAGRYFRLALQYSVGGSEPAALIVMGRAGSGKSTLARELGRELGWAVFSSDRVRKELAGVPLHERPGPDGRRQLYSPKMNDRTYAALARLASEQIRQRRCVILDATFARRDRRDRVRRIFERAGVGYCFIEARAPMPTIRKRLAARERSSGEVSDARLDDLPILDRAYEPPHELTGTHLLTMNTARPPEAVVVAALKTLAQRCAGTVGLPDRP